MSLPNPSPELLCKLYVDDGLSVAGVAAALGRSEETTRRLLISAGIPRRPKTCRFGGWNKGKSQSAEQRLAMSVARKAQFASGELKHWAIGRPVCEETRRKISTALLDGRDPAPSSYGPDWKIQRTSCLQRDGHQCQQCGSAEDLEVHHWEPYRFSFDNSLENLVTLCGECHDALHVLYRREGFIADAERDAFGAAA